MPVITLQKCDPLSTKVTCKSEQEINDFIDARNMRFNSFSRASSVDFHSIEEPVKSTLHYFTDDHIITRKSQII